MDVEIDDMDNIVFPGEDSKSIVEESLDWNAAIAACFNRKTMSDWDFSEVLEEIVHTDVVAMGALKKNGKKYRMFKWFTVRAYP